MGCPKMIDSYKFGEMVIEGKRYSNDVIVFPDRVVDDWWRKEGHKVHIEDLEEILDREPKPEVLILGTGYQGLVDVPSEVKNTLESHGIKLVEKPTTEAYKKFNKMLKSKDQIAGAFHLTC